MKNRALLSVLALSLLAAACDSKKTAEPPKPQATAAVVPLPPAAPQAPAASANQDAKPVQLAQADPKATARPPKGCGGNNCKIDITVGDNCSIKASPDPLPVFAKDIDIKWSISTGGWKFAPNGIEFKKANTQFSANSGGNTNNYKWKDANGDTEKYDYAIHVVNGDKKCDADPSIVNGAEMEGAPPY